MTMTEYAEAFESMLSLKHKLFLVRVTRAADRTMT